MVVKGFNSAALVAMLNPSWCKTMSIIPFPRFSESLPLDTLKRHYDHESFAYSLLQIGTCFQRHEKRKRQFCMTKFSRTTEIWTAAYGILTYDVLLPWFNSLFQVFIADHIDCNHGSNFESALKWGCIIWASWLEVAPQTNFKVIACCFTLDEFDLTYSHWKTRTSYRVCTWSVKHS